MPSPRPRRGKYTSLVDMMKEGMSVRASQLLIQLRKQVAFEAVHVHTPLFIHAAQGQCLSDENSGGDIPGHFDVYAGHVGVPLCSDGRRKVSHVGSGCGWEAKTYVFCVEQEPPYECTIRARSRGA